MEKIHTTENQGCCSTMGMCNGGRCKSKACHWIIHIVLILLAFGLGMHFGFSKAMRHRGGGSENGGCMMGKSRDRGDDENEGRRGQCGTLPEEKTTMYKNDTYGFSLSVPNGLQVEEGNSSGIGSGGLVAVYGVSTVESDNDDICGVHVFKGTSDQIALLGLSSQFHDKKELGNGTTVEVAGLVDPCKTIFDSLK